MINRKLYLQFITREISPLLKSDDQKQKRIGLVKSALLHSWIDFMNEKEDHSDNILEAGFKVVRMETENWQKIERSMPSGYKCTYGNVMAAIVGMIGDIKKRSKEMGKN